MYIRNIAAQYYLVTEVALQPPFSYMCSAHITVTYSPMRTGFLVTTLYGAEGPI